jgi:hypothetical protein
LTQRNFTVEGGLIVSGTQVFDANGNLLGPTSTLISTIANSANSGSSYANSALLLAQAAYNQANTTPSTLANGSYTLTLRSDGNVVLPNVSGTSWIDSPNYTNININAGGSVWTFNTSGYLTSPYNIKITPGGIQWTDGSMQNTAASPAVYSQAGFNQANLAYTEANSGSSYANSAFVQANLAYTEANSGSLYANSAFVQANLAYTEANSGSSYANSAFIQANLAYTEANSGSSYANSAFIQANLAYTKANSAYSSANVGYNFVYGGGTVSGNTIINGNLNVTGNITYIGNATTQVISGNTGEFFGASSNGFNALYAGIPVGYTIEPQTVIQATTNYNGYSQIENQNIFTGANASTDFVATNDNMAGDSYIDMGINSTIYSQSGFTLQGPGDGYLYVNANTVLGGGNLVLSTTGTTDIVFSTNGINTSNEVARFKNNTGLVLKSNGITFADGTYQNTSFTNAGTYANAAFVQANAAFNLANSAVTNTSSSMSGTLYVDTVQANTALNISTIYSETTNTYTTSSTSQVSVDSFSTSSYRSAKYEIQMVSGTSYHVIEIRIIHNGTTVYMTQYGEMFTSSSLGTFDASITSGTLNLLLTPINTTTTIKLNRRTITT